MIIKTVTLFLTALLLHVMPLMLLSADIPLKVQIEPIIIEFCKQHDYQYQAFSQIEGEFRIKIDDHRYALCYMNFKNDEADNVKIPLYKGGLKLHVGLKQEKDSAVVRIGGKGGGDRIMIMKDNLDADGNFKLMSRNFKD